MSRLESEESNPRASSIAATLESLGFTWRDLAEAIDELEGRPTSPRGGQARATWVEGLRRQGIDEAAIESYAWANSDRNDPAGEADLVASAQEAARLIAESALEKRRRTLEEIEAEKGTT